MTGPVQAQPSPPPLKRNLSFHFLWTSTFASGFADRLAMLAVGVMLGQGIKDPLLDQVRLGDAAIVAGINFWFFLPYVLWGPLAGWLADRLPRKWLMFIADEARGLLILAAYWLIPPGSTGMIDGLYQPWFTLGGLTVCHLWKIWAMMFTIGLFAATFSPARNSVIPNVVGYKVLQRANSIVIGMGVIGNLFGFAVGGKLAEQVLRLCILTSSLSYLIPGWMWPFLKTPVQRHPRPGLAGHGTGPWTALVEVSQGARYILTHRPLLVLTGVGVLFWSGAQIILASGSTIAVDLYGGTVAEFAYIGGSFGLGMLAGAVLLGWVNSRTGGELFIIAGMIGSAVFLSLLAVVPNLYAGIVLAVGCGLFGGFIMISTNTMVQQMTADGYRGRVMGFKDLAGDIGSVVVALIIWQMPRADQHILTAAHAFSALLLVSAVGGFFYYMMKRGPTDSLLLNTLWRVARLYAAAMFRLTVRGGHRIPATGPVLLVANHTCGADPLLIQAACRRPVRFLMARDYHHHLLGWFWRIVQPIPVQRDGTDRTALRRALALLDQGQVVAIFPEGGYHHGIDRITDFHAGVGLLALRSGAPVLPIAITGTRRCRSVAAAFFLPTRATVTIGPARTADQLLDLATGPHHDRHAGIARRLRQIIVELAAQAPPATAPCPSPIDQPDRH